MSELKVVPIPPTPEMVEAAEEAYMPFGDMDLAIQMALLTAPDVQGEPVAHVRRDQLQQIKTRGPVVGEISPSPRGDMVAVYAAPQPTEQQTIKSDLARNAANHLTNWLEMDICECEGDHTCGYNEVKRTRDALLAVVEQQPISHDWDDQDKCRRCGDRDWYADATCTPSVPTPTFRPGDHVRKTKGSQWKGRVVGTYSTSLTPEDYAVESDTEKGSVQIYPVGALELVGEDAQQQVCPDCTGSGKVGRSITAQESDSAAREIVRLKKETSNDNQ